MSGVLAGKSAMVTGAASGIGRAAARRFAAEGARVLCCDIGPGAADTAAMIVEAGGAAAAMIGDAGREEDVAAAVADAVARFGALHVLYANAGVAGSKLGGIFDSSGDDWADILRVNLIGPMLAIKHGAPAIEASGGGAIICTASVAGLRSGAGPAAYSASKAGVINLVQTAAQQVAGKGVRINAVAPGLIETEMTRSAYDYARSIGKLDRIGQLNPLLRGGEPEEIAAVALFLASDEASYIHGQTIVVDGGLSTSHPTARKPGDAKGGAAW